MCKFKNIVFLFLFIISMISFTSCSLYFNKEKQDKNGYDYIVNNSKTEAYLIKIPNNESLTIPEYIDNYKVTKLGYKRNGIGYTRDYIINGTSTKALTITHEFEALDEYVNFPNLIELTFNDLLYCFLNYNEESLVVPHYIGKKTTNVPDVILKKTNRNFSLNGFIPKVIYLPDYIKEIDSGVFDGLNGVTIKTSYESQPDEWENGWSGNCTVEWGVDIEYFTFTDYIDTTSDGIKYYHNPNEKDDVIILDVPDDCKELVIPEYINGNKVVELGYKDINNKYKIYGRNVTKLTVNHYFDIYKDNDEGYVYFCNLAKLIFVDYTNILLNSFENEVIIPYIIGENDNNSIPSVELRKSNKIYDLTGFIPKVIVIPDYVKIIDSGVFDGLNDVTIKTSFESQPEGWKNGWNGNCIVEWGVTI